MLDTARRSLFQKSLALFFAFVRRYTVILCTDAELVTILVLMHGDARMELDGVFIFLPTNWPGVFFFFWFGNFYEEQESNVQYIRTFRYPNHMILIISPDPI